MVCSNTTRQYEICHTQSKLLKMEPRFKAQFEYEIRENTLNLYERIITEEVKDALKFLVQVSFEGDLEMAIKQAIDRAYQSVPNSIFPLVFEAKDLFSDHILTGIYKRDK